MHLCITSVKSLISKASLVHISRALHYITAVSFSCKKDLLLTFDLVTCVFRTEMQPSVCLYHQSHHSLLSAPSWARERKYKIATACP